MKFLFIIVNALFVAKYSARIFPKGTIYITLAYIVIMVLALWKVMPWLTSKRKMRLGLSFFGVVAILTMIGMQAYIDPFSLQVDRWSALHYPIDNLLHGKYPYSAQTHLGGYGSPFPIWQVLHIPFYILGNVGLSFFFFLTVFLYTIYKSFGFNRVVYIMSLIVISPAIWYEAAVRSDYIGNILLSVSFVIYITNNISQDWVEKHRFSISTAVGLLACTRLITLLPLFILLLPYWLKLSIRKKTDTVVTVIIVCILAFLPIVLMDINSFFYFEYNPWTLQTRQGDPWMFLVYIPFFLYMAMQWKGKVTHYYRNTAWSLAVFVSVSFLYRMYDSGNYDLFSSWYDITYYNAIIPFVCLCMSSKGKYSFDQLP